MDVRVQRIFYSTWLMPRLEHNNIVSNRQFCDEFVRFLSSFTTEFSILPDRLPVRQPVATNITTRVRNGSVQLLPRLTRRGLLNSHRTVAVAYVQFM